MLAIKNTIEGLQEAQDANIRLIEALKPKGAAGEAVKFVTTQAHRYLVGVTHVESGAYKASHRMKVTDVRGQIFIDPTARKPRTGQIVSKYAKDEEARGGSHAAYQRTIDEAGPALVKQGADIVLRALP